MSRKKNLKILFLIYSVFVIIKIILSFQVPYPVYLTDEREYLEMAKSFLRTEEFFFDGQLANHYPPLYPIFISPLTLFDSTLSIPLMRILNSLISTSIIFPIYLISRKILNQKKLYLAMFFSLLIPEYFVYSFNIMSENLFYPLFLFSTYFMINSFSEKSGRWDILTGIFIGLSVLTRMIGLFLLVLVFLLFLFKSLSKRRSKKKLEIINSFFLKIVNKWKLFLMFFLLVTPWFIRSILYSGANLSGFTGYGEFETKLKITVLTFFQYFKFVSMHIGYVIFSSGILFFVLSIIAVFDFKKLNKFSQNLILIVWLTFFILVLLGGYWSFTGKKIGEKIMGRYVSFVTPLLIIIGLSNINLYKNSRIFLKLLIVSAFFLTFLPLDKRTSSFDTLSTLIIHVPGYLHTINLIPEIPDIIIKIFLVLTPFTFFIFKKHLKLKFVIPFFLLFFVLSSTAAFLAIRIASFDAQEYMDFAIWINYNIPKESKILFYKKSEDPSHMMFWMIESVKFWTENEVSIGILEKIRDFDYVFSTRELNLTHVHTIKADEGIFNPKNEIIFFYSK